MKGNNSIVEIWSDITEKLNKQKKQTHVKVFCSKIFLPTEFIQRIAIARVSLSVKGTTPVNWFVIHLALVSRRIYFCQLYV